MSNVGRETNMKRKTLALAMAFGFGLFAVAPSGLAQGILDKKGGNGGNQGPPKQSNPPPQREQNPPPQRQNPPPQRDQTPPPSRQNPPFIPPKQTQPPPGGNGGQNMPPQRQNPPPREQTPPKVNNPPGGNGGQGSPNRPPMTPPQREQNPPIVVPPQRGNTPPQRGDQNPPQRGGDVTNPPRQQQGGSSGQGQVGGQRQNETRGEQLVRERVTSRSGSTQYGSQNNRIGLGSHTVPVYIDTAPTTRSSASISFQVLRESQVYAGKFRQGYYHNNRNWRDDYFCYPYYYFEPYWGHSVISPWYYYPNLPGYLASSRCLFLTVRIGPFHGYIYDWSPRYVSYNPYYNVQRNTSRNEELDLAMEDLVYAFERYNIRAIDRLIDRNQNVNIFIDDQYAYTLYSDDFRDLMVDNIQATETRNYTIEQIRVNGNVARVIARHDFIDPWGRYDSTYHFYQMRRDRYGYTITDFGTSRFRTRL